MKKGFEVLGNDKFLDPSRQYDAETFWKLEYRTSRYLQHLNDAELTNRGIEIISNIPKPREVKLGISFNSKNLGYWMRLLIHVIEETKMRGGKDVFLLSEVDRAMVKDAKTSRNEDPVEVLVDKLDLKPGSYLVKYGKSRYLTPMYSDGSIRISPASTYNDFSLNAAVQDNELEDSILIPADKVKYEDFYKKLKVTVGGKSGYLGDFAELSNFTFTRVCNKDFFVSCLCFAHSLRMFEDFEADTCLLITKPKIFLRKVISGFEREFPDAQHHNAQVKYYDPILDKLDNFPPYFSKHFKYYYQNEYRLIWLPCSDLSSAPLDHVSLKLGSLAECSELVNLNHEN